MILKRKIKIQKWLFLWTIIYGSIAVCTFFFHVELINWFNEISDKFLPLLSLSESQTDPIWIGSTVIFHLVLTFICGQILYNIDSPPTLLALTKTLLTAQFFSIAIYFSLFILSQYSNLCLLAIILHCLMFLITYTIRFEVKKEA